MKLDDEFQFGKYIGSTPRDIIHANNGLYLMWCLENIKNFHLEPISLEETIRQRYRSQYIAVYKSKK